MGGEADPDRREEGRTRDDVTRPFPDARDALGTWSRALSAAEVALLDRYTRTGTRAGPPQ